MKRMGTTELELSHEKNKILQTNAINNTYDTTNIDRIWAEVSSSLRQFDKLSNKPPSIYLPKI